MAALEVLKGEINQAIEAEHDFAKWKLIVVAAIGGVSLGLGKEANPNYWLLLLIPFACMYIDLELCQLQLRMLVLAQFIRACPAVEEDTILQEYENRCADLRLSTPRAFNLGQSASRAASVGLSVVTPIAILATSGQSPSKLGCQFWLPFGIVWAAGVVAILVLWSTQQRRSDELENRAK